MNLLGIHADFSAGLLNLRFGGLRRFVYAYRDGAAYLASSDKLVISELLHVEVIAVHLRKVVYVYRPQLGFFRIESLVTIMVGLFRCNKRKFVLVAAAVAAASLRSAAAVLLLVAPPMARPASPLSCFLSEFYRHDYTILLTMSFILSPQYPRSPFGYFSFFDLKPPFGDLRPFFPFSIFSMSGVGSPHAAKFSIFLIMPIFDLLFSRIANEYIFFMPSILNVSMVSLRVPASPLILTTS